MVAVLAVQHDTGPGEPLHHPAERARRINVEIDHEHLAHEHRPEPDSAENLPSANPVSYKVVCHSRPQAPPSKPMPAAPSARPITAREKAPSGAGISMSNITAP